MNIPEMIKLNEDMKKAQAKTKFYNDLLLGEIGDYHDISVLVKLDPAIISYLVDYEILTENVNSIVSDTLIFIKENIIDVYDAVTINVIDTNLANLYCFSIKSGKETFKAYLQFSEDYDVSTESYDCYLNAHYLSNNKTNYRRIPKWVTTIDNCIMDI